MVTYNCFLRANVCNQILLQLIESQGNNLFE